MRIRHKKHLQERVDALDNYLIVADNSIPNVLEAVLKKDYLDYEKIFSNDNPVCLEIGCGKGGFIIETAKRNPNTNFIAVELLQNIIVMAAENLKKENLPNLVFFNCGAEYLPRFIKPNSVSTIYLNFSPPFPPKSNENRRLTNLKNIANYDNFLIKNGSVIQKTDDKTFFDYSFNNFLSFGFSVKDLSGSLNSPDNVKTEYEKKFIEKGLPIFSLSATKNRL